MEGITADTEGVHTPATEDTETAWGINDSKIVTAKLVTIVPRREQSLSEEKDIGNIASRVRHGSGIDGFILKSEIRNSGMK